MKIASVILTLLSVLFVLTSCGQKTTAAKPQAPDAINKYSERQGSPYQYQTIDDGHGTVTYAPSNLAELASQIDSAPKASSIADAVLQKDILKVIGATEKRKGGSVTPELIETRRFKRANEYQREVWIINRQGKTIPYLVTFKIISGGKTAFKVYPMEDVMKTASVD